MKANFLQKTFLSTPFSNKKKKKFIRTLFYISTLIFVIWIILWFYFTSLQIKNQINFFNNHQKAAETYAQIPPWHKKINTRQEIKIGIITDTHLNILPYRNSKIIPDIELGTVKFIKEMKNFQPNFIVHLGDVIEGTSYPNSFCKKQLELTQKQFSTIKASTYWIIGNHDLRCLTSQQFKKILNLNSLNYVVDKGDYRFIFLDANYNQQNLHHQPHQNKYISGHLPPQTITWLKKQLRTRKRVFIFMHQGLFPGRTTPSSQKIIQPIDNAEEIKQLFEKYRVDGFFNGHMEVRAYYKGKYTHYYSLTGTTKNPYYTQSFYELKIQNGIPNLTMYYFSYPQNKELKLDFEKMKNF